MTSEVVLEMTSITKYFPGIRALESVNLSLNQGEVLALVGENGAGKSTLMNILCGAYPYPDYEGEIKVKGATKRFTNTNQAQTEGISMIHQELNLIPGMTVAENILLGSEPIRFRPGIIDWQRLYSGTKEILGRLEIDINPASLVKDLTVGQQQTVEIAKALARHTDILILDEPTSALTEVEVERLFEIIKELRKKQVSMVYISHRLNEVFQIADRVTVLRDGTTIGTNEISKLTRDEIISMMVGRDVKEMYPKEKFTSGEIVLELKNYSVWHPELKSKRVLKDINFYARKGEILGISGLMGSGRTALVTSLFGAFPGKVEGEVCISGKRIEVRCPQDAIRLGIGLVTEDRRLQGLVLPMPVGQNITLSILKNLSTFQVIDQYKETQVARKYFGELSIRARTLNTIAGTLSGGNQQKTIIGKWLATKPRILLLDEPTRGIDVGAKVEIYNIINGLVKKGVVVIVVSSELPEILGMCDRILVMHEGRITGELTHEDATQEKIMNFATGGK